QDIVGAAQLEIRGRGAARFESTGLASLIAPPSLRGAQATKQSSQLGLLWNLRGACHRARIRATRWLAMTDGERQFALRITASRLHGPPPAKARYKNVKQRLTARSPSLRIGKKPRGKCSMK